MGVVEEWVERIANALTTSTTPPRHEVTTHVVSKNDPVNTQENYLPCNKKRGPFIMNRHLSK